MLAFELRVLRSLFDAFGQGLESESLSQLDQGANQSSGLRRVSHGRDEGTVDLESVDRELLEISQRRVAGAEIVDGNPDAYSLESGQTRHDGGNILHDGGLGDLNDQRSRLEARRLQRARYILDQLISVELARRDVYRDVELESEVVPACALATCLFDDPSAHVNDHAGVFENGDKVIRLNDTAFGMAPAQEGLDPGGPSAG